MNLRETIADWLTGGGYSSARIMQLRCENHFAPRYWALQEMMFEIEAVTADVKSGTARKINRMAKEALR